MKKKVSPQLPKGFKPISGGGGNSWDYKNNPVLEGILIQTKEIESQYKDPATGKKKMQKLAIVKTKDGAEVTVWESAGTRALFDVKKGKRVAVVFKGLKKIKGRKEPMKDFEVGVA